MDSSSDLFGKTPAAPGDPGQASHPSPAMEPGDRPDPEVIGRYKILACISRTSGQGMVYRAHDPELDREVVIKLLRCRLPLERAARERLLLEGRLLARVNHPGIVRIHDVDLYNEQPYYVLEPIQGLHLGKVMEAAKVSTRTAARIISRAARSLGHVHSKGVVHRDIKPGNIVLDEDGAPWIIDFGVGLVRDVWSGGDRTNGEVSGTFEFMAPEQARGDAGVGPAADIFSLGGVLYCLLTGKAPFEAGKDRLKALERARQCDFDQKVLEGKGIPQGLARLCLRAMAKEQKNRYARAEDLAAALDRWLRRRPLTVASAILAVVAAILVLAIFRGPAWKITSLSPEAEVSAPDPSSVRCSGPWDHAWRGNVQYRLRDIVPVRSGDYLNLSWEISGGLEVALFWFGSEGILEEKPLLVTRKADGTKLVHYPEDPEGRVPIIGPHGTEIAILCLSASKAPTLEEVRDLFPTDVPWPRVPSEAAFEFDPTGIHVRTTRGAGSAKNAAQVERWTGMLEALRVKLAKRFKWFSGLAFSHVE